MVLIFDLSGVFFNDGLTSAVQKISQKYNLDPSLIESTLNGEFAKEYRTGLISSADFWQKAKTHLSVDDIDTMRSIFFESYYPHPDSVALIKTLRNRNIKIGYLSNSPEDRTLYLDKKFHFIPLFDFGIFSYQAHAWKPDKSIYQKLMQKNNLLPSNIVYIDDRERDLRPAQELGMDTILFKDTTQLQKELRKRSIVF
jgi:putative hydrolase of the HAD superfamily